VDRSKKSDMTNRLMRIATKISFQTLGVLLLVGTSNAVGQGVLALRGAAIETASADGTIEKGTILIRDGRIEEVGKDIEIPLSARVIDMSGKTIMPGIVDPYFVVNVNAGAVEAEERVVVFGGRTFRIPSSPAAAPTSFVRIIDGFDPRNQKWNPATRSGITSAQLVARGFGESVIAKIEPEDTDALLTNAETNLFIALTNQTSSLEVLRKGLEEEKRASSGQGPPSAEMIAAIRARRSKRGGPPSGGTPEARPTSAPTAASAPAKPKSPQDLLWDGVKSGKRTLFVNVNNASSILYLSKVAGDSEKVKVALIAGGDDLLLTFEQLDAKKYTLIMPPRIDLIPNSRDRVNVARMLEEAKYEIAFSLSLNQNEYLQSQDSPLFSVSMLVRSGLSKDKAMKALTIVPAKLLGIDKEVGSIEKGKRADFVVLDDEPFSATAQVTQVIVDGEVVYEN
jgi:hypothetical protein